MGDIEDFASDSARGNEEEETIEVKVTKKKIRSQKKEAAGGLSSFV